MHKIKVVIADDHPIVLLGLREIILRRERFELAAEATSSSQLIAEIDNHAPHVVITDFNMPGDSTYGDGLKLIEYLGRRFPGVKILVLTMVSNSLIVNKLLELGVFGVIQKSQLHNEIDTALSALSANPPYRNPARSVPDNPQVAERFARLSPKEAEVLRLFVAGNTVSHISQLLARSKKTISGQKMSAMRKLEVDTDQSLLQYCMAAGEFQ